MISRNAGTEMEGAVRRTGFLPPLVACPIAARSVRMPPARNPDDCPGVAVSLAAPPNPEVPVDSARVSALA
jgi:hypothetical protein